MSSEAHAGLDQRPLCVKPTTADWINMCRFGLSVRFIQIDRLGYVFIRTIWLISGTSSSGTDSRRMPAGKSVIHNAGCDSREFPSDSERIRNAQIRCFWTHLDVQVGLMNMKQVSHCEKWARLHTHTDTHTTPPPVGNTLAEDLCLQTVLRRTDRRTRGPSSPDWSPGRTPQRVPLPLHHAPSRSLPSPLPQVSLLSAGVFSRTARSSWCFISALSLFFWGAEADAREGGVGGLAVITTSEDISGTSHPTSHPKVRASGQVQCSKKKRERERKKGFFFSSSAGWAVEKKLSV